MQAPVVDDVLPHHQIPDLDQLPYPEQCKSDPDGVNGVIVFGDGTWSIISNQTPEVEELPHPVQCLSDPAGLDGVIIFGDKSWPINSVRRN